MGLFEGVGNWFGQVGNSIGQGFDFIGDTTKLGWDTLTNNGYIGWQDMLLPGYSALNKMFDFTGANAANAQYQNQLALQQQAQAYNSAEADKSRQWQEMMSNSEVQRRMADIKAAGLNPWLALGSSMSGGSTPSGSSASSSTGNADMANNKLAMAAGLIATALRIFLAKH